MTRIAKQRKRHTHFLAPLIARKSSRLLVIKQAQKVLQISSASFDNVYQNILGPAVIAVIFAREIGAGKRWKSENSVAACRLYVATSEDPYSGSWTKKDLFQSHVLHAYNSFMTDEKRQNPAIMYPEMTGEAVYRVIARNDVKR